MHMGSVQDQFINKMRVRFNKCRTGSILLLFHYNNNDDGVYNVYIKCIRINRISLCAISWGNTSAVTITRNQGNASLLLINYNQLLLHHLN